MINMLYEILEKRIEECKKQGVYYGMIFKPYCRKILINPKIVKQGNNLFFVSQNGSIVLNINQADEISIDLLTDEFYEHFKRSFVGE